MKHLAIVGTGLIGTSLALALRAAGFDGEITGIDGSSAERAAALSTQVFHGVEDSRGDASETLRTADAIVLATPVLAILDWMERLSPLLEEHQLVTDVGSTKLQICMRAAELFNGRGQARFLPGHPMAGKETGGAAQADAALFREAAWLFTPLAPSGPLELDWRSWVARIGALARDIDPVEHDEVLAWVSHLPQMVSTALAAELQERFGPPGNQAGAQAGGEAAGMAAIRAIGGRALRETTRLGASPYSMWRDVALTNTEPIAAALHALEQRLQHIRENLRTPGLRDEFGTANQFRAK